VVSTYKEILRGAIGERHVRETKRYTQDAKEEKSKKEK
jgi:hypothetical protein